MYRIFYICIGLLFMPVLLGLALALTPYIFDGHSLPPAPPPGSIILDNVNIVPISVDGVLEQKKVAIIDGRISGIETAGPPYQSGLEVLDLEGRYLLPGLVDMHVHIDDREQLRLALSYGVTAVRNMHGMPIHLRWMKELRQNQWLGSRLYSTSPVLHGDNYSSVIDIVVQDVNHARELSAQFHEEGWDFIKVYSGLGLDEFRALIDKVNSPGPPIVGHIPYEVVAADYSLAGEMRTVEHVEEVFQGPLEHSFEIDRSDEPLETLADVNAIVCPTLSTFENLTRLSIEKSDYLAGLPTDHMTAFGEFFRRKIDIERWLGSSAERGEYNAQELEFLKLITKKLDEHGVQLVLGTDSGTNFVMPGPSLWQEMKLMLDAGLMPGTVLRSATLNPAVALGIADNYGSIDIGKIADFVLVESNPLERMAVLESVDGVFVQGNYLDRDELNSLRSGHDNVAGWWVSTARYLEAIVVSLTRY